MDKICVSGMGAVSVLGTDAKQFWENLIAMRSGIKPITSFSGDQLRNQQAGQIVLSPEMLLYAEKAGITSRLVLFACLAIDQALRDSGWEQAALKPLRVCLILGTSLGMSLVENTVQFLPGHISDPGKLGDNLAHLSAELDRRYLLDGKVLVVSTACASGTHAIGLARDMLIADEYDLVICGGADSLDRMKYLGHTALNTLTPDIIRPFDTARNGTLFGEGAAFLVLEKSSLRPGRKPYALCTGAGYSCDAYHVTTPDPDGRGAEYAMRDALRDAGLEPGDIDHINLHGSGTRLNDSVEGSAVARLLGIRTAAVPCTSVKAAIAHTMGAAGALEAVAAVLTLVNQEIPPTLNVDTLDPEIPLNLVYKAPLKGEFRHVMSSSFGFGGSNGVVIFSRS